MKLRQARVLAVTDKYRELALQIFEQFKAISAAQTLKACLITGGADMRSQAIALAQRPHLIIATPGRLADHIRSSGQDTIAGLNRVKFLVLDEADRLLSSDGPGSMVPDLEECLGALPPSDERQTLLFTATMTPEVRALESRPRKPGKLPVFVSVVDNQAMAIPATLNQMYIQVPVTHKEHYLHTFLLTDENVEKSIIVFVNKGQTCEYLHHLLRLLDHRVVSLSSKLPQRERINNLGRFRASAARVLVATDVAARGLDIPEVSMVINYDLPRNPDDYIHRVGKWLSMFILSYFSVYSFLFQFHSPWLSVFIPYSSVYSSLFQCLFPIIPVCREGQSNRLFKKFPLFPSETPCLFTPKSKC